MRGNGNATPVLVPINTDATADLTVEDFQQSPQRVRSRTSIRFHKLVPAVHLTLGRFDIQEEETDCSMEDKTTQTETTGNEIEMTPTISCSNVGQEGQDTTIPVHRNKATIGIFKRIRVQGQGGGRPLEKQVRFNDEPAQRDEEVDSPTTSKVCKGNALRTLLRTAIGLRQKGITRLSSDPSPSHSSGTSCHKLSSRESGEHEKRRRDPSQSRSCGCEIIETGTSKDDYVSPSKRSRQPPSTLKMVDEMLLNVLPVDLREIDLAKQTIELAIKVKFAPGKEKVGLFSLVQFVKFYRVQSMPKYLGAYYYPWIDGRNYLFYSPNEGCTGFDYETMLKNDVLVSQSLFKALSSNPNSGPNTLDTVFRKSLKEISQECAEFDFDGDVNILNPHLISGRYLELRLIQKIQDHYRRELRDDIVSYFKSTIIEEDQHSKFKDVLKNCVSEGYVRRLIDQYTEKRNDISEILEESLRIPENLRVWTNRTNQTVTNASFITFLNEVYKEVVSKCGEPEDPDLVRDKRCKFLNKMHKFTEQYAEKIEHFLEGHRELVTEMVRTSELMAYMCFGISTDEEDAGTASMAISYFMIKNNQENHPSVCWNYPLASLITPTVVAKSKSTFKRSEFIKGINFF